jgi:hypothetical protein
MTGCQRNTALLILGMHRSGTSALAGVLSLAGADPGSALLPAMQGINPKGFWEHAEIVAIHERLLATLNSSWADERPLPDNWLHLPETVAHRAALQSVLLRDFSRSPLWLVKDPRLCRLLPLWLDMLADIDTDPRFVLCLRHPCEVAASLARRDGIAAERACLLWLAHLLESERWSRGRPRAIVTYDRLLADWRVTLEQVAGALSLPLQADAAAARKIDTFLESSLRHHRQQELSETGRLCRLAAETYALMESGGLDHRTDQLAQIAAEVACAVREIAPWAAELCALYNRNRELSSRVMVLAAAKSAGEEEILRMKNSLSWRLTAPLRVLAPRRRNSS